MLKKTLKNSRKKIGQQILQTGLMSPASQKGQLNNNPNQNNLVQAINRKFFHFMKNRKIKKITSKLKNQRGRNNVIKYQQDFNFKQQWQHIDKSNYSLHYNYFFPQKFIYRLINLSILCLKVILIWILSIFRLFQYEDNLWIFSYCIGIEILDSLMKTFFIANFVTDDKIKSQHKMVQKKVYLQCYIGSMFNIIYSILGLTRVIDNARNQAFLILDIGCILFAYLRCQEIYRNFKMEIICTKYKAYMKIFDLMSNLFLLTHIFGILIFAISRISPNQTYLSIVQVKGWLSPIQRYIYSIYFSSTTMLTVGYGDLLPANVQQIAVVLVMQLFGIVMIGYINGQVSDVLCTLRSQRQNLQNDLTNTQKLSKTYKLSQQTTQKIRQYLVNNRKIDSQLNIQDQNHLLGKLNDQLRLEANYTNHINIVKESIFFVYNFSKKTQIQISNKLNKIVFSPNQNLVQLIGKQKIFLLSKGEIAIYISKRQKKNKGKGKVLRILSKNKEKQLHQNSFGHTALILGRPNQLKAYSKDFAICHTLQRHDFLDALSLDTNDWQSFHQMRAKYEIIKNPQKQQAPQFYSIRQHFSPNGPSLIKKYLTSSHHQTRKLQIRNRQKCRRIHQLPIIQGGQQQQYTIPRIDQIQNQSSCSSISTVVEADNKIIQQCLTTKQRQNKYKSASHNTLSKLNIRSRGYEQKYCNKKYQQKRQEIVSHYNSKDFQQPFECYKQYQNFLKHSNVTNVIRKLSYQNTVIQFVSSFIQIFPTFKDNNLDDVQIEAKLFRHKRMLKSLPF